MKSAKYTLSDSESDVEDMDVDNDDFIFDTEFINFLSTDLEFENDQLPPVKVMRIFYSFLESFTFRYNIILSIGER